MKDAAMAIRKGAIERLAAINGVKTYDQVLPNKAADKKYILITSQTQNGARTKDCFMPLCTLTVDINTRFLQVTGKLACDEIAGYVLNLINPISSANYIDLGPAFQCVNTQVIQNSTLYFNTSTQETYRRIIVFQFKVLEK